MAGFLYSYYQLSQPGESAEEQADSTFGDLTSEFSHLPPGDAQDFGTLTGTVHVSSTLGDATPQSEVELSSGSDSFDIIADPSGNYQMFVPLNDPNFNDTHVDVQLIDPLTGTTLGSEIVDLSNLTEANPLQIPTLVGQCSDDDASSPDGDDPDCD